MVAGCAPLPGSGAESPRWEGVWCWGSPRRSSETPFLRVDRQGDERVVRTKHYMHGHFEALVRDVHFEGNRLRFSYWYAPLRRWATCRFTLSGDVMAGECDAEISAHRWGSTPSHLWREGVITRPAPQAAGGEAR